MTPAVIRWKRGAPAQARSDCAQWLYRRGYVCGPIFGDIWLVRRRQVAKIKWLNEL